MSLLRPAPAADRMSRGGAALLALYGILLAFGLFVHEPWSDEAHAWLMARELDLPTLLFDALRYEGTPGLWHVALWIPAQLGCGYWALKAVAFLFAFAGAYQFLRHAPFPPVVRALLPFGFFLLYQYGVVARSYVMLPLLLALLARLWPARAERPWALVAVLAVLSQVSLHGVVFAGTFFFLHAVTVDRAARRRLVGPALVLGVVFLLTAWQLWLPEDLTFSRTKVRFGTLPPGDKLWKFVVGTIDFAFGGGVALPAVALGVSVWWFRRCGTLALFAVPGLALIAMFLLVAVNLWHTGLLYLLWLTVAWITYARRPDPRPTRVFTTVILLVAMVDAGLAGYALVTDARSNYSGARDAAAYLKERQPARIYATNFNCDAILPYFDENIFANWNGGRPPALWKWSSRFLAVLDREQIVRDAPDLIVWGIKYSDEVEVPPFPGYREVARFTGLVLWKGWPAEHSSFAILAPDR